MLRVARLTDRTGRYYLADLASELGAAELGAADLAAELRAAARGATELGVQSLAPFPADRAGIGRWSGEGATGLGLSGPVGAEQLEAVLSGRHPHGGHQLRHSRVTITGYDLVFAAPKSVSVLFALGPEEHSLAALDSHRAAVDAAMAYVAGRAAGVRAGSGEERRIGPVRGLVASRFDHGVSRALDPHLHSHAVLANMGQDADGRWRALDGRGVAAHARAAGALYDAHLRHALTERCGARWSRRRSGTYELASVDPIVLGALSARQAEIREHLHHHGAARGSPQAPSGAARAVAWAVTRDAKSSERDRTPEDLRRRWLERAAAVGWTRAEIDRSLSALGPPPGRAAVDEHRFAASLFEGTLHGGSTRRDVVVAWAQAVRDGSPAGDVERCVDALATWPAGVGVAETPRPRAGLVPSSVAVRALGPRPATPRALGAWMAAARTVDGARERGTDVRGLGSTGASRRSDLARLPIEQLADRLAVERVVIETRRRLGMARVPAQREADRSLGRG